MTEPLVPSEGAINSVREAVLLMAGSGARLRQNGLDLAKPLVPVLGRPLISYTLEALAHAGVGTIHAIVGFEREIITAHVRRLVPPGVDIHFIHNRDWEKQNGLSLLAAAGHVNPPFLLAMSDHLFDQSIIDRLVCHGANDRLNVAIDRKLDSIFDLNDATKVQTRGHLITSIGKELVQYDAVDTGIFVCGQNVFDYLEWAKVNGDCSVSDGVRLMAEDEKVWAIDIDNAWWQDIDTPMMLASAARRLRERSDLQANTGQVDGARPTATVDGRCSDGSDKRCD
jgi:1L-myo-inositol 1-phosphate cytidylyltransferase